MIKAPKFKAGELRIDIRSRDEFKVDRHDQALGCVDLTWLTGPEKGLTQTYREEWVAGYTELEGNMK